MLKSPIESRPPLISLRGVSKQYDGAAGPVAALRDLTLDIGEGEFVAVIGSRAAAKPH